MLDMNVLCLYERLLAFEGFPIILVSHLYSDLIFIIWSSPAVSQDHRRSGLQRAEGVDGDELHTVRRADVLLQSRQAAVRDPGPTVQLHTSHFHSRYSANSDT